MVPSDLLSPTDLFRPDSLSDSLNVGGDSTRTLPPSTALVLAAPDAEGRGDGITFVIQGTDRPETGTYDLSTGSRFGDGFRGGPGDGATRSSALAFYSRLDADEFMAAPSVTGSLTIEASTDDVVRGTFDFQTALALVVPVDAPFDSTLADRVTQRFYPARINGSFSATPDAALLPPTPAGSGR